MRMIKNKKKLDKVEKSVYKEIRCPKCHKLLFQYMGELSDDIFIRCSRCKLEVYPLKVRIRLFFVKGGK